MTVYLMNYYTGSVDSEENWAAEGWSMDDSDLIEVEKKEGRWVEVK
jgi:hypothetical protein